MQVHSFPAEPQGKPHKKVSETVIPKNTAKETGSKAEGLETRK